ncbi:MAG: hypothetical protein IKP61_10020 [Spirochaetales bacterium]|jgi:hypothetical protein|nr:FeoB-associated Cys-rich membrane protein [Thermoplasmata archaeon]MBR6085931.1 hypothetical protein [Spirochaetales bacterium]MBR6213198.1 hypothetical protein [Candidatus Methanomethylophilaceae archaeon]
MNVYELIIIAVVALLVINAIVFLIRSRRRGKNGCSCERSCSNCTGCSGPNVTIEDDSKKE